LIDRDFTEKNSVLAGLYEIGEGKSRSKDVELMDIFGIDI
jgi:hypothetical protein